MARVREWLDRMPESWAPPTPADVASPWRYLFWLTRSQGRRIAAGATLGTCWTLTLTMPPWVLARAVDDGLVAGDTSALIGWALVMLATTVVIALLSISRHRTMSKIRMDASYRSARTTVWHTTRLGASLERRVDAGEVVTIGITDVQTVARALTVTGPGVGAVVAYGVVAVVLFTISPLLAGIVLAGVPLLALAVGPLLQRIERTGGNYRVHQGLLTTRLVDALAGLRVLNGLGGKDVVAQRYAQQSQELVQHGYRVAGPTSWVGALAGGLPALFLAAVVWLSARMAATGAISIGEMVAVHGYVAMLVVPVAAFIEAGGDLARARVAGQRIIDLLNLPVTDDLDRTRATVPDGGGPLVDIVSGVTVRPGLLTALVAARPAEAHAVIERLGRVSLDSEGVPPRQAPGTGLGTDSGATWAGVPVRDFGRQEFRSRLTLADNDATIFAGTVREIVAGQGSPDDDRIRTALHIAAADDVVAALPGGLDAGVAPDASDLSGGQRQRLRLARAVYGTPDVLLAIDPTSAVDAHTEATVIDRLHQARRTRTTVVTTTSPLVLDRADEVIVLADGRVTAVGTHTQLLRDDAAYRAVVSRSTEGGDR